MINKEFFQQPWIFRGQLVISKGEKVLIKMARYNLLEQKYEAQEIDACNLGIKFRTENAGNLYQLPFLETNVTGIIEDIVVNSRETQFRLITLPEKNQGES